MIAAVLALTLTPLIAANIAADKYARPYRYTPRHRKEHTDGPR